MKKQIFITVVLVAAAAAIGYFLGSGRGSHAGHDHGGDASAAAKIKFWTCSMHPQIQQPKAGKCKICGMDLIAVSEGSGEDLGPRELRLSESAAKLAEVEVVPVTRRMPVMDIRMVGKIEHDETRIAYITARFPGRLDRLYVDYTGVTVKKGDHLASIYSPQLLVAQQELIQAKKNLEEMTGDILPGFRERTEATLQSAREKLRLWDLTPEQIKQIEVSKKTSDHLTIYAPISGVVIHKNAVEGMYLETGGRVYTIADLSSVWVKFDAYESDLQWLHFGQEVEFETEAYPGETFSGRIAFIDPVLNPKTRTVKVRLNVANPDGRLKPEMFVRGTVKSKVATGGRVMDSYYAGKWISPMHPEIVSDQPGNCTVCGMPLVSAESLGYAPADGSTNTAPLVIPVTAPLITGKRAVVYVTTTNRPGVYEGRDIILGPRAGDVYIVKAGLQEGELVVTRGNFKIDSAIQILAKPSMMNPGGGRDEGRGAGGEGGHGDAAVEKSITPLSAPPEFVQQLRGVVDAYALVGAALDSDRLPDKETLARLSAAIAEVDMGVLSGEGHMAWMGDLKSVSDGLDQLNAATDIAGSRQGFELVSAGLIRATERFGVSGPLYQYHCPMAFGNRGANWLQTNDQIRNPYYGAMMLKCGKLVEGRGAGGEGRGEEASKTPVGKAAR